MSKQMAFGKEGGLVEYKIRVDVSEAVEGFKNLESVFLRYLVLLRSANLPEDQQAAITVLAQVAVAARTAQMAVTSLMVATGPVGIAFATIGLMMAGVSGIQTVDTYLRRPQY